MSKIITRKEAKKKGLVFYFSGSRCVNGHIDKRYTSGGRCYSCKVNDNHERHIAKRDGTYEEYLKQKKINQKPKKSLEEKKEKTKESSKKWRLKNKEKLREKSRLWRLENKEKKAAHNKEYREKNREKIRPLKKKWVNKNYNAWRKKKLEKDPIYKLTETLRRQLLKALKKKSLVKDNKAVDLLGIDIKEFKIIFEKKFKPGMTWENHGQWHIDHIKPLSKFNLHDPEEQKIAFHYTNLQPLWADENLKKSNKY